MLAAPGHNVQDIILRGHKAVTLYMLVFALRGAIDCNGFSTEKDMYYVSWPSER